MDVWDAVVASSWESDGSGDTVLEGLSLWSVWAVLKRTGGWVFGSSWNINVSWLHVCWPWFLSKSCCCCSLDSGWISFLSWIDIIDAIDTSDGNGDTILEGISLWSVWAVFEGTGGWCFGSD